MTSESRKLNTTEQTVPQAPTMNDESTLLVVPSGTDMIRVGLLGAALGVATPLLGWLIQRFLIAPIFCREGVALTVCRADDVSAYYIGTIILTVVAIALMANWQIFRPLLVAAAASSALWGMQKYGGDMLARSAIEYYIISAVIFATVYLLFYWLLRLKSFTLSVVLSVIAVVIVRWALLG